MVYTEKDLIVPALLVMRESSEGVDTSVLIDRLTAMLNPTGHDAEIIEGRSDTYFSQKVRNLKSHDTLENLDLAAYEDGIWTMTDEGRNYLEEAEPIHRSLVEQGMTPEKIDPEFKEDLRDIVIEEGALDSRTVVQRERSGRLRRYAVEHFREIHGRVFCEACDFDFEEVYGDLGRDCIEVHHEEAIHTMEIEGTRTTLEAALGKASLLCSNCHTIVHRRRNQMLSMEELRSVLTNG